MKRNAVFLLFFCSLHMMLVAQTDSSWFDLGRIKLKKEFTQTITIKGKDLAQMPFARLDEAINMWLSGLLVNKYSVTYVIDGNLLTDANAYSVHDIEEITLVQNALVQLNGAPREKQLLLITTKKHRDSKSGITVAGSSAIVKNSEWYANLPAGFKSETNVYHRYDVSAWQNSDRIQYGVSAGYLRDVFPYAGNSFKVTVPHQVKRFRFNGYLNARLDPGNSVWLRAGYFPGVYKARYEVGGMSFDDTKQKKKEPYFTIEAGLRSRLSDKFTNEFSAGYTPVTRKESYLKYSENNYPVPPTKTLSNWDIRNSYGNLLISDHFQYQTGFGGWKATPSVDVSFRHIDIKSEQRHSQTDIVNSLPALSTYFENKYTYNVLLATPALNMAYRNLLNVQAGFVYNFSGDNDYHLHSRKLLPFVNLGVDVLQSANVKTTVEWKVFGSYAAAGNFGDEVYQLQTSDEYSIAYPYPYTYLSARPSDMIGYEAYQGLPVLYGGDDDSYIVQAGSTVSMLKGRVQAGYNYQKRKYTSMFSLSYSQPAWVLIDVHHNIHHMNIAARVLEGGDVNWFSAFNAAYIRSGRYFKSTRNAVYGTDGRKPMYTGGWVNRVQYKKITAGLDVLYVYNITKYTGYRNGKDNAISLSNIYVGYQLPIRKKPFDVYIECRNPIYSEETNMPDRRKYYGAGFKATL